MTRQAVTRQFGLTILTLASMIAYIAATQEVRAQKKDDPVDKKAEIKKGETPEAAPAGDKEAAERIKKIIERLHENMDASEEKLGKKDTSDDTRKIQDQILKDLDELINQKNQGGGGGGGGGGAASAGGGGGGGGASGGASQGGGSSGGGKNGSGGGANHKGGKGSSKNDPQNAKGGGGGKKDDKLAKSGGDSKDKDKDKNGHGGGNDPQKKEGKGGGGLGGKGKDGENTVADLFKDIWGHLPQKKRDEMDAYSRERFLPKYEELLRQYYRTISEQGRRKEGE
ncbi:MAG: hypothetical protein HY040_21680 [Planctomycetes bacterium]|nr:hypothetical protein [Planctomycetota bacterium]